MTTKRIHGGLVLESLFTSRARVAVLELVLLHSNDRYYLRQIASLSKQPVRAVQRELAKLEAAGLLVSTAEGNRKYYRANRQAPVFPELRSLLLKTAGLGDLLSGYVERRQASIVHAFLFGSYARGADDATSDIDLMIIGEIPSRELARLLKPAREVLGREINVVNISVGEFRQKVAAANPFILSALDEPKIFLIGGDDELRQLAGGRPAKAS